MYLAWFPANNGVLTGLGEDKVTKPPAEYVITLYCSSVIYGEDVEAFLPAAVNIVPVNVAGAEVGEVAQLRRENLPALTQVVAEEKQYNFIHNLIPRAWIQVMDRKKKNNVL